MSGPRLRIGCMGIVLAAALSVPTPSVHAGGSLPPGSSLPTIAHPLSVPSAFAYCRRHPRIHVNATVGGFHLNIPRFILYGKEGALFGSNEVPIKAVVAGSRAVSYGGMDTIIPLDSTVAMLPDFSWTQLQGILHCGDSHRFGTYVEVYGLRPVTTPPIERIHTNPSLLDATQAAGICRRHPRGRVRVRVRGCLPAILRSIRTTPSPGASVNCRSSHRLGIYGVRVSSRMASW